MTSRITEPDIAVVVVTADTSDEALRSDGTPLAIDETHGFTPVEPDVVMLAVPVDEAHEVIAALNYMASTYRAEGNALLCESANRLEAMAGKLEAASRGGR